MPPERLPEEKERPKLRLVVDNVNNPPAESVEGQMAEHGVVDVSVPKVNSKWEGIRAGVHGWTAVENALAPEMNMPVRAPAFLKLGATTPVKVEQGTPEGLEPLSGEEKIAALRKLTDASTLRLNNHDYNAQPEAVIPEGSSEIEKVLRRFDEPAPEPEAAKPAAPKAPAIVAGPAAIVTPAIESNLSALKREVKEDWPHTFIGDVGGAFSRMGRRIASAPFIAAYEQFHQKQQERTVRKQFKLDGVKKQIGIQEEKIGQYNANIAELKAKGKYDATAAINYERFKNDCLKEIEGLQGKEDTMRRRIEKSNAKEAKWRKRLNNVAEYEIHKTETKAHPHLVKFEELKTKYAALEARLELAENSEESKGLRAQSQRILEKMNKTNDRISTWKNEGNKFARVGNHPHQVVDAAHQTVELKDPHEHEFSHAPKTTAAHPTPEKVEPVFETATPEAASTEGVPVDEETGSADTPEQEAERAVGDLKIASQEYIERWNKVNGKRLSFNTETFIKENKLAKETTLQELEIALNSAVLRARKAGNKLVFTPKEAAVRMEAMRASYVKEHNEGLAKAA